MSLSTSWSPVNVAEGIMKPPAYISSAWLPFPVELRLGSSDSVCPATTTELFPDWLPLWIMRSKLVISEFSIGSWGTAASPGGPDKLRSEDNDEESDWTAGLSSSSDMGWEDEASVRMFLEMTRKTFKNLDFVSKLWQHIKWKPWEAPTSCGSVVVVCRQGTAERTETGHDDQTQRDQDDLRTHTNTLFISLLNVQSDKLLISFFTQETN